MKPVSKKLDTWADLCLFFGITMIVTSIIGLIIDGDAVASCLLGFFILLLSPINPISACV